MNLILYAIPFFLLLIFVELVIDWKRGSGFYRFNDVINSLSLGLLSRIIGIIYGLIGFSLYYLVYENFSFTKLPSNPMVWCAAFVLYDLAYYWAHRFNHRVSVMWGSHVVHHSSEEYNLTTALRQTSTPSVFAWLVYLPLAIIGFSPLMLIVCGSLNLIYQFWVHTRHIDRMPKWFEAIFVTPSHHRVHHALNKEYIDKNYAGVFIVWDRIFGSFKEESTEFDVIYGVSHQLKSWNPLWANIQIYTSLLQDAVRTRSWLDKIKVFLKPPGWRPDDVKRQHPRKWVTTRNLIKYDVKLSVNDKRYILVQFVLMVTLALWLLINVSVLTTTLVITLCSLAIFNLVMLSALQEKRPWCDWLEPIRLVITGYAVIYLAEFSLATVLITLIIALTSATCFYLNARQRQENLLPNT